jgi:hypothetical protein
LLKEAGVPHSLIEVFAPSLPVEVRSSWRLARRTRTYLTTFDRSTRPYDQLVVAGVILIAVAPAWAVLVALLLIRKGLL